MSKSFFHGTAIVQKSKVWKIVSILLFIMLIATSFPVQTRATDTAIPIVVELNQFSSTNVAGDNGTTLLWSRGNASVTSSGVLRLARGTENQKGVVVRRSRVKLTGGFSTYFVMNMNSGSTPPADGLAFVIQSNSEPLVGNYGAGLGFQSVPNSLGVEFDIWKNTGSDRSTNQTYYDQNDNHVSIVKNGDNTHATANNDVIDWNPGNLYGNGDINVWIDYDGTTLKATYGKSATRSSSSNRSISKNVGSYIQNQDVYVGFSGSTGDYSANIDIKKWYFSDTYVSSGLDPDPGTYTQGANSVGITLIPGSTNPTSANFRVKDENNRDMYNQNVAVYLDDSASPVATINTGTSGTQATYNIGILSEGTHSIKGVAANGGASNFVTFSVLKPSISPTTLTFDKNSTNANYGDKAIDMTLYAETLSSVKNGSTTLTAGTNYTVSGSKVTLKKEYFAAQSIGTTNLTFNFSDGSSKNLAVTVCDSTPPTGLTATGITQTSVILNWTATPGATSYKVYKGGTQCASPTTNTASIPGLTAATLYSFTVSAVNAGGETAQSSALPVTTLANVAPSILKVLEVQPGTTYDLTPALLSETFPNSTILITPMSMAEFISKVDEINGQYDVVYVGNNTSGGVQYSSLGKAASYLPVCETPTKNGSGSNPMEYYSENDITNRRADTLKDFITSKQLTIFDKSIFDLGITYKLYNNFSPLINTYNFVSVDTSRNKSTNLKTAFSGYGSAAKRPILTLTNQPDQYDGSDASYSNENYLGYAYNISNLNNSSMHVNLYVDLNGDGIFSSSEIVTQKDYSNANISGSINYPAYGFVGLQPWKLEVTNKSTGSKTFKVGTTAFKAMNSGGELKVRVLQLQPSGNTFSIYSLSNIKDPGTNQYVNLLYKDKVYNIEVTEMSVANFNSAYANLTTGETPKPVSAKVNGVTKNASTVLNGNYDMAILGFNDSYGGNDLNTNAINALQSFIDTNQSVMFTHDTIQYHLPIDAADFPGTYKLTDSFRKLVGQQRYYYPEEMLDSTRHYDGMPTSNKFSYGYSNKLLDRFKTGSRVGLDTTTKSYKVNENLVTQFPFVLGDIPVATTHYQWFQLDLEDPDVVPVYTLYDNSLYKNQGDGRNDYYTYTKGTITYSGTGHSSVSGNSTIDEEKMFVNTMIKASRGANHAPTLEVNGISDNMTISKTLPTIDFTFTATDIDERDPYLNADVYLSADNGAYQNVQHFSASDPNSRVINGEAKSVSIPTVNANVKTYKVKVVAYDNYNAEASKEIIINCVNDPSITVSSSVSPTCLVGDTLTIPVTLTAQATGVNQSFTNVGLTGVLTKPDNSTANVYNSSYPNLQFNPSPSWSNQQKSFSVTFGTLGNPETAGTYVLSNKLSYKVNGSTVQPNPTTTSIKVESGTIGATVKDQNDRPITGVSLELKDSDESIVATGSTSSSGYYSFTGLSSGDYTVKISSVPTGRTIVGESSIKTNLSVSDYQQEISFKMGGTLLTDPLLTAPDGSSQMTTMLGESFQTVMGLKLSRPVKYLDLVINHDLLNSTAGVVINKVTCNDQLINFTSDGGGKILPSGQSGAFPSGTYKIEATVAMTDGTMQSGKSFTLRLDGQTSAMDANTESVEDIGASSAPLTVKVTSILTDPSLTTRGGTYQMDTLINAALQMNVGFKLMKPVAVIKVDLTNSYASTTKIEIAKIFCENEGKVQEISFIKDTQNPEKLLPSGSTQFPSGKYTIYTTVSVIGSGMKEGDTYTVSLTDKTSVQPVGSGTEVCIDEIPQPVKVFVLTSPKYH